MKSPTSFLLLLAATGAAGYHGAVRRRASSINNSTETEVKNDGCPLCTCNDAIPSSTTSDDIIEVSVLMLDAQVSSIIASYFQCIEYWTPPFLRFYS